MSDKRANRYENPWNLAKTKYPLGQAPKLGRNMDAFTRDYGRAFAAKDMERKYHIAKHEEEKIETEFRKVFLEGDLMTPELQTLLDAAKAKIADTEAVIASCKSLLDLAAQVRQEVNYDMKIQQRKAKDLLAKIFPIIDERLTKFEVDIQLKLTHLSTQNNSLMGEKQNFSTEK